MSIPGQRGGSLPDPTVEPRVIEAVLDEPATCGRDGLSMDRIANRAGVSEVSIYRRWRTEDDLLAPARDRDELDADVAIDLLAEVVSALTLRRVMFGTAPIDHTLRADINTLIRHPLRRP